MSPIHVKRFGFACATVVVLLYLGCILLMATVGRDGSILFFNTLLHGIDTSSTIQMNVPVSEALMGIVQTFILGWLIGASVAACYNVTAKRF